MADRRRNEIVSVCSRPEALLSPYLPPQAGPFIAPVAAFLAVTILVSLMSLVLRGRRLYAIRLFLSRIYLPVGLISALVGTRWSIARLVPGADRSQSATRLHEI